MHRKHLTVWLCAVALVASLAACGRADADAVDVAERTPFDIEVVGEDGTSASLEAYSDGYRPGTTDTLRLGVRNVDNRFAIYHVDDQGLEQQLVEGRKGANERVSISNAVLTYWNGQDVLAIRSGVGGLQRWEAFIEVGPRFELSAALSHQIWDAADIAEVEKRLRTS